MRYLYILNTMKTFKVVFWLGVIFIFMEIILGHINSKDNFLVGYYINLITNQTKKAMDYKFPSDARMYQADSKFPNGKNPLLLLQNILLISLLMFCLKPMCLRYI